MLSCRPAEPLRGANVAPYVLLVDDHVPSLRILSRVVEESGHRCVIASSGREAVQICEAFRPQVVVTDLSMPNLDGLGLACWLKARYLSIPIVLMTGELLDDRKIHRLQRTFSAVFPKPVDIPVLLDYLARMMPVGRERIAH